MASLKSHMFSSNLRDSVLMFISFNTRQHGRPSRLPSNPRYTLLRSTRFVNRIWTSGLIHIAYIRVSRLQSTLSPLMSSKSNDHRMVAHINRACIRADELPGHPRGPRENGIKALRLSSLKRSSYSGCESGRCLSGWNSYGRAKLFSSCVVA